MKSLKKNLTDSLDQLSAYPRVARLSQFIKKPAITIPPQDYTHVAALIIKLVIAVPAILFDEKNQSLDALLVHSGRQENVIPELYALFEEEPTIIRDYIKPLESFVNASPQQKMNPSP